MKEATIGHYRIVDKLGEGGMGVVYKAVDLNLERTVALKVLAPHALDDGESKARFLREARAAALLEHANICGVYEVGEDAGRPYLCMAFIEGQNLKEKIAERPLKLDAALDIAMQAAEGLKAAHDKGVVHRDIKSANLMVSTQGQVKVTDFGLAQLAGQSTLTKPGATLGTVGYMAPEIALGKPADRRSDIWSLGVVLYEMLTGRLPFVAANDQAVLFAAVSEPHEPVTALRVGVPTEVDRIIGKALAKDPGERYQYIDEMLVDLRALRRRVQTGEVRLVTPRRDRRKLLWAGAGTLALVAAAAGIYLAFFRDRAAPPGGRPDGLEAVAVLPLRNLSGDPEQEYFADGITEALITDLAKISALRVTSQRSVMQYKQVTKPLPEIARELNVSTVVEGSVAREGNRVRVTAQLVEAATDRSLWAESYDRELSSILALQGEIARAVASGVKVKLRPQEEKQLTEARKVNPAVYELYLKGMHALHKSGRGDTVQGLDLLHQALELDPADALAHAGLAQGYLEQAHGSEAREDSLNKAKAAARTALNLDPSRAEAAATLGFIQGYMDWDWEAAFQTINLALAANPSMPMAYYQRAWFNALFGRLDQAVVDHQAAQRVDPFNPLHTSWLGELYRWQGRNDLAVAEAQKAIAMAPNFAPGHFVLALAYQERGRHDEAIAAIMRAIESAPRWRWALLPFYVGAGRAGEARTLLAELEKEKPLPWSAFWRVIYYSQTGDYDAAFKWAEFKPHHVWAPWYRVLPWGGLDGMRKDPRFPALLRRMNLPPLSPAAPAPAKRQAAMGGGASADSVG